MKGNETHTRRPMLARLPLATAIWMAMGSMAWAQDAAPTDAEAQEAAPTLGTVTVTAQKRSENLQKVPISIQVMGGEQLEEMHVADLDDILLQIPAVSFQRLGEVPSNFQVYMRGVASGGDGNHSGPQPSVGVYVDEQPVTTIRGAIDVHAYDIERVEALAGPQGTLYGASSQAGTIRIITKKPETDAFLAGYSAELNTINHGGTGSVVEGFANFPISDKAALRVVGWNRDDAGYIDNRLGTRTFPTSGITIDNADRAESDYNDAHTVGARAALKIDLNDNWTITPTVMTQRQDIDGSFGSDPNVGELATTQFYPQTSEDRWTQSALTVQGQIGNFDVTYAFSYLDRDLDTESDYSDYAFWYDTLFGYGTYFYDDNGDLINPSQYIQATNGYKKRTHELRIASPVENRFRFVGGVFWQQQSNAIQERYLVDDLADSLSIAGWTDTIWLTKQQREDHDEALFGELSYDLTEKLTATAGMRFFRVDNSLRGFFGLSEGYFPGAPYGEAYCSDTPSAPPFPGTPCEVFNKEVKENDSLGRFNLTYNINDDAMVYGTWSEGYRPGGINRRGTLPPYFSDFLTNWEFGWKTKWADGRLSFNGAAFSQDWEDFQFGITGANGLPEIKNAAQARIRGVEFDLAWAATYNLRLSGGMSFYDAELTANYCGWITPGTTTSETHCPAGTLNPYIEDPAEAVVDGPQANSGDRLPITADFKGNLTARYTFDLGEYEAFWQTSLLHEGKRSTDLRLAERALLGDLDAYTMLDFSAGVRKDNWSVNLFVKNVFDERAEISRFTQCAELVCGDQPYTVYSQPRTIGVRFSHEFF